MPIVPIYIEIFLLSSTLSAKSNSLLLFPSKPPKHVNESKFKLENNLQ